MDNKGKRMNIYQVNANLINTIAGKERLLTQWQERAKDDETAQIMCSVIKLNLEELKRILADVEVCCIQAVEDSWRISPDRSGGQFGDDEINRKKVATCGTIE